MYLLGHLGFTALSVHGMESFLSKKKNYTFEKNYTILLIGSMMPDLIDKPIGSLMFETGRWFGHSILFIILSTIIMWILLNFFLKRKQANVEANLFAWGCFMHLILDTPGLNVQVIFWPLLGMKFSHSNWNSFLFGIYSPFVWLTEFLGLIILIGLAKQSNLSDYQWKLGAAGVSSYIGVYLVLFFLWVLNV
ncbi:MAG: metal-dependent hydrolase [Candidatus Hodarchaeales archaeon]|jgi:hypothetical protein